MVRKKLKPKRMEILRFRDCESIGGASVELKLDPRQQWTGHVTCGRWWLHEVGAHFTLCLTDGAARRLFDEDDRERGHGKRKI